MVLKLPKDFNVVDGVRVAFQSFSIHREVEWIFYNLDLFDQIIKKETKDLGSIQHYNWINYPYVPFTKRQAMVKGVPESTLTFCDQVMAQMQQGNTIQKRDKSK